MKFIKSKKGISLLAVIAVVAIAAVGAYAYWSTTGTGTGTATVGTNTVVTIAGTSVGALTPGGQTGDVSFTVTNSASGPQYVTSVSLTGVTAYSDSGHTSQLPAGTCDTSKFVMAPVTENYDAPTGTSSLPVHGTLHMVDDLANSQDGCKGAFLGLNLTSS